MVQVHKAELEHLSFASATKLAPRSDSRIQPNILIHHLQLAAIFVNVLEDGLSVMSARHLPDQQCQQWITIHGFRLDLTSPTFIMSYSTSICEKTKSWNGMWILQLLLTADDLLIHFPQVVMHLGSVRHQVTCSLPFQVRPDDLGIREVEVLRNHVDNLPRREVRSSIRDFDPPMRVPLTHIHLEAKHEAVVRHERLVPNQYAQS
jgi:hypothetical protein